MPLPHCRRVNCYLQGKLALEVVTEMATRSDVLACVTVSKQLRFRHHTAVSGQ